MQMFFEDHSRIGRAALLFVVTLLLVLTPLSVRAQRASRITGTYTSMYFNKEGGDLLGEELKIVLTSKGYQGALQFAEGEPSELMIVDVQIEGNKVSFIIPATYAYAGQFSGTIQNGVIRGMFRFKGGGQEVVELKKGKSYWD